MSSYVLNHLVEGYDETKAREVKLHDDVVSQEWIDIYSSRQNKTILQASIRGVEEKTYGQGKEMPCAIVEIGDVRGLIPLEYLGVESKQIARDLIGEKVAFIVIAIDKPNDFFVGSRIAALEEMASHTFRRLAVGDDTIAVVRKVFNGAMIVDVGGIESRIDASLISYGWVDSVHDHYKVGDHVKVKVIGMDKKNKEIAVSVKATKSNPWDKVSSYYSEMAEYVAKVSGVTEFGTFVELREGISGLAQHLRHETLKKGDNVLVRVTKIRPKEEKINVKVIKVLS